MSIADFNIPAGISPTGVDFVPSDLKMSRGTSFLLTS